MAKNLNRGRLSVVLGAVHGQVPAGMRAIGTVTRAGMVGTLAIDADGRHFFVADDGHFDPLPDRKVLAAIDAFKRPTSPDPDSGR